VIRIIRESEDLPEQNGEFFADKIPPSDTEDKKGKSPDRFFGPGIFFGRFHEGLKIDGEGKDEINMQNGVCFLGFFCIFGIRACGRGSRL
jgi:hypothetical protein